MRLLIASTPRSGNTWLRKLIADALDWPQVAVHTPADVDWNTLPSSLVLQLHWLATEEFRALVESYGFRVLVLARHPLDVLISILHFAPNEPDTSRWLAGTGGDEAAIIGRTPVDSAVVDYACSPRFGALLQVSAGWWRERHALRVRYEDLVNHTVETVGALCEQLPAPQHGIAAAVERNRLEQLRLQSTNEHFWQGRPGLWRTFLPSDTANLIYRANKVCFAALGYSADADPALDFRAAIANWHAVA